MRKNNEKMTIVKVIQNGYCCLYRQMVCHADRCDDIFGKAMCLMEIIY